MPVCGWCVDRGLHVAAVEVDYFAWGNVVARVDGTEDAPWVRAGLGDVVDVEARIYLQHGCVDRVEHVAGVILACEWVGKQRERTRWRELQVCVEVGGIVAEIVAFVDLLQESIVEEQQILPVINEGHDDSFLPRLTQSVYYTFT